MYTDPELQHARTHIQRLYLRLISYTENYTANNGTGALYANRDHMNKSRTIFTELEKTIEPNNLKTDRGNKVAHSLKDHLNGMITIIDQHPDLTLLALVQENQGIGHELETQFLSLYEQGTIEEIEDVETLLNKLLVLAKNINQNFSTKPKNNTLKP